MQLFPESLYLLSERDRQVTWLDPRVAAASVLSPATTVRTIGLTVPIGRILLLHSASARFTGGAGQNANIGFIALRDPGAPTGMQSIGVLAWVPESGTNGNAQLRVNWSGAIVVPPGWEVWSEGTYSAAVNDNQNEIWLAGMLLPAGNVQRV